MLPSHTAPHPPTRLPTDPPSSPSAGGRGVDAGALVHRYGKEFLYADPPLALEYYMLAADALGGSVQVRFLWGVQVWSMAGFLAGRMQVRVYCMLAADALRSRWLTVLYCSGPSH